MWEAKIGRRQQQQLGGGVILLAVSCQCVSGEEVIKKMVTMETSSTEIRSMVMSSIGAWRRGMDWRGMDINLSGYNCEVLGGAMLWGWYGLGSGRAGGRCAFPLVIFT